MWTPSEPDVQVTFLQNGKSRISVPAKLMPAKYREIAVSLTREGVLEEIQLPNQSLVFDAGERSVHDAPLGDASLRR
jgi:hypothetical protein